MRVELAYADDTREILIGLDVGPDSTVLGCVESSGLLRLMPALHDAPVAFVIFGRHVEPSETVSEGDRIEVLRPLAIDPREARRLRASRRAAAAGRPAPRTQPT